MCVCVCVCVCLYNIKKHKIKHKFSLEGRWTFKDLNTTLFIILVLK